MERSSAHQQGAAAPDVFGGQIILVLHLLETHFLPLNYRPQSRTGTRAPRMTVHRDRWLGSIPMRYSGYPCCRISTVAIAAYRGRVKRGRMTVIQSLARLLPPFDLNNGESDMS
jgi:hypothetical protein